MLGFAFTDTDLDTLKAKVTASSYNFFQYKFDQELIIISNFMLFDKLKYLVSFKYQSFQNSNEP